ncbi:hypothetical protein D3C72_1854790 [compost metagenome]
MPAAALHGGQAQTAICHMLDLEALVAQVHTQQLGDVFVVFDDQNAFGGVHRPILSQKGAGKYHDFLNFW